MSEKRISEMEQDLAVLKSAVPPLMRKMDESTRAQIELTHEIKALVESNSEAKDIMKDHSQRIHDLEAKEMVRESADEVLKWAKRAVTVAVVGALMGLILIK